jgi:hypothetical protein
VGRPVKEPEEGERAPLSLRVRPIIKRKLEESAELNGRSLSQEAEFRLEHTFDRQGLFYEVMALALGKKWASFFAYFGPAYLNQFNEETSEQLRNIFEKTILARIDDANVYREKQPVHPEGRRVRREVAEIANILKSFGSDVKLGGGAYERPKKKRKGKRP